MAPIQSRAPVPSGRACTSHDEIDSRRWIHDEVRVRKVRRRTLSPRLRCPPRDDLRFVRVPSDGLRSIPDAKDVRGTPRFPSDLAVDASISDLRAMRVALRWERSIAFASRRHRSPGHPPSGDPVLPPGCPWIVERKGDGRDILCGYGPKRDEPDPGGILVRLCSRSPLPNQIRSDPRRKDGGTCRGRRPGWVGHSAGPCSLSSPPPSPLRVHLGGVGSQ